MICDLHIHSNFSDGTCTVQELVSIAKEQNISTIALCDHNTVSGLDEFLKSAKDSGVYPVPGIEFSTDYNGKELHILGLFIQEKHFKYITEILNDYRRLKEESNLELIKNLSDRGYVLDYQLIKDSTADGFVNRANIAAALTEKGYTNSINEAFRTLLNSENGLYHKPKRPSAEFIIKLINKLGSVSVLAHPFLNLNEEELRSFLDKAVTYGLDGMETYYSLYDEETTELSLKIADEYKLLKSGGSDFHGDNKPDIKMGTGKGNLNISFDLFENIEKRFYDKNS
ncbi:MAG: PHP domain-containing protein [Oscillospiraceae bacterium]|nr:PHP domain-containing protein [Oscillospiraceae bacterium]